VEAFSSREVAEWRAYASIEPFGEERADLRARGLVFKQQTTALPQLSPPSSPPPREAAADMDARIKAGMSRFKKQQG
jgi:hypothetical protein